MKEWPIWLFGGVALVGALAVSYEDEDEKKWKSWNSNIGRFGKKDDNECFYDQQLNVRWSIGEARRILQNRPPNFEIPTSGASGEGVNKRRSLLWGGVNISIPVIVIPANNAQGWRLIDGRHRLYKAHKLGRPTVPAHLLTEQEANSIICSPANPAPNYFREQTGLEFFDDFGE